MKEKLILISLLSCLMVFSGFAAHSGDGDYTDGEDFGDVMYFMSSEFNGLKDVDLYDESNVPVYSGAFGEDGCYMLAYDNEYDYASLSYNYNPETEIKKANPLQNAGYFDETVHRNEDGDRLTDASDFFPTINDEGLSGFDNNLQNPAPLVDDSRSNIFLHHQIMCHDRSGGGGNWVVCNSDARTYRFKKGLPPGTTAADSSLYACQESGDNWASARLSNQLNWVDQEVGGRESIKPGETYRFSFENLQKDNQITEWLSTNIDNNVELDNSGGAYDYKVSVPEDTTNDNLEITYNPPQIGDTTTKSLSIEGDSEFSISILNDNEPVKAGEDFETTVEVTNTGTGAGSTQAGLSILGTQKSLKTDLLNPGESTEKTFTYTTKQGEEGDHTYEVVAGEDSETGEVEIKSSSESVQAGFGDINAKFFDYGQGVDLTNKKVGFKLENVDSQWRSAFKLDEGTKRQKVTIAGVETPVGTSLIVDAECWLGKRSERPSSSGEMTQKSRTLSGLDTAWITMSIPDRNGVDNNTYSCLYGMRQYVPKNQVPENVETAHDGNFLGIPMTWIVEGTNTEGKVDSSPPTIEVPETGIPGSSGSSASFNGWGFYPGSEFASETRNPLQWLKSEFF